MSEDVPFQVTEGLARRRFWRQCKDEVKQHRLNVGKLEESSGTMPPIDKVYYLAMAETANWQSCSMSAWVLS